ncbi:hypothetical protein CQW23_07555 [Capsicum baccatum]|uniref:Retrovirus-related Pol polyprotein from transposon TNT 1-94-like beta-barrel domain-containing protein n=1 Tax=Capsicum baccatum TaxID=33114 RepID=A0A2G2X6J7_CAPBA|nr:hypothetical protein CQW23_07555 [Capsicum baccatum]
MQSQCYYCHIKDHIRFDCPKLKNKRKYKKNEHWDSDTADEIDGEIFLTTDNFCSNNEWILDSVCSSHIYPNKDLFSTYNSVEDRVVLVDNNVSCKIIEKVMALMRFDDANMASDLKHVLCENGDRSPAKLSQFWL